MGWMADSDWADKCLYQTSHNISHPTALPYSVSLSCLRVVCACLKSIGLCAWARTLSMSCVCTEISLQSLCVHYIHCHVRAQSITSNCVCATRILSHYIAHIFGVLDEWDPKLCLKNAGW